jgi:plastocyanin domain-containing protein
MAVYSLNGVLLVLNSPVTVNKFIYPITYFFSEERFSKVPTTTVTNGVQEVTITVSNNGYRPNKLIVKSGQPVKLTLQSKDAYSCAAAFIFAEFGINTFLEANDTQTFTFTPKEPGKYQFSCSMGMYTGVLEVI